MNHKMRFLSILFVLFIPILSFAHLISVVETRPFPDEAPASSISTATFTITNITGAAVLTIVNQSNFPSGSGLSVSSSTCGTPIGPAQSCTIDVSLNAASPGRTVVGYLKVRAEPSLDVIEYPIVVSVTGSLPNITLVPIATAGSPLPALRDPIVAEHNNQWLILSGSLGTIHDFSYNSMNKNIYVYNPVYDPSNPNVPTIFSVGITSLPSDVQDQLSSVNPEFIQDGDTLYIIGGLFNPGNSATDFHTLQTITSIDVPGMMNAIINSQPITSFVHFRTDTPQFQVTGGQLGKIGTDFYLVYGMECDGFYNNNGVCNNSQVYTNSVYQFALSPSLSSPITIINTVSQPDLGNSGWRRRDYTLAPFMIGDTETLLSLGGPFTTPGGLVWTNDILLGENITYNNNFHTQQANQYLSPHLSIYSQNSGTSYLATFGSITTLYWGTNGLVFDNNNIPFGNVLDLVSADASGNVQEYANTLPLCGGQPLSNCLYMGVAADFIPVSADYYDSRHILQLDQLPLNTATLVGYIYGGLISPVPNPFFNTPSVAYATNQVYAVYVTPSGSTSNNWLNITNLNP